MEFDEWKNFWLKNGANAQSIVEKSFSHIKQHNIFNELFFISFIVVGFIIKLSISLVIILFDVFIKLNSINLFNKLFIWFSNLLSKISIKL